MLIFVLSFENLFVITVICKEIQGKNPNDYLHLT